MLACSHASRTTVTSAAKYMTVRWCPSSLTDQDPKGTERALEMNIAYMSQIFDVASTTCDMIGGAQYDQCVLLISVVSMQALLQACVCMSHTEAPSVCDAITRA